MTRDADGRTFVYDALNKQTQVKDSYNQPLGNYVYDGDGQRLKKLGSTENTLFVYDAFGSLVAEYAITPPPTNPSPNVNYLTTDTLGSPRIVTGKNGEILSRRDFMPFGEEISRANYGSDAVRGKFTGYEKDIESSLEFAQNRYYSNKHGRFTTPDPLMASGNVQDAQSWNRYAYTRNNPTNLTDSLGLYYGTSANDPYVKYFATLEEMAAAGYTELKDYVYMVGDQIQVFRPGSEEGAVMVATQGQAVQKLFEWGVRPEAIEKLLQGIGVTAAAAATIVAVSLSKPESIPGGYACGRGGIQCMPDYNQAMDNIKTAEAMNMTVEEMEIMVPPVQTITNTATPNPQGFEEPSQDPNKPTKPINLPSYKKVKIDIEHIIENHTANGNGYKQSMQDGTKGKDKFPDYMTPSQIEKSVRNAYKNSTVQRVQGDRVVLRGATRDGTVIEMWFNRVTKTIETAYPKF